MTTLTILRGISGSGKSTYARARAGVIVVSRDDLRATFFPNFTTEQYYASPILSSMEDSITRIQDAAIAVVLTDGHDVIVDDTNIEWKYVKRIADIGFKAGADVEIKVFDVPLNTALERNAVRGSRGGRIVPENVIRKQHKRLQGSKNNTLEVPEPPRPYTGTPGKPKAFLVDIDGTLAHMGDRGPFDWKRVGEDDVDEVIAKIVWYLYFDYEVIVMSGRDESCRVETEEWLYKHGVCFNNLFMRPKGDMRKDSIVKAELFDTYVRDNFDVQFVLDDRNQVVDMWRAMGIKCLQVAEGDF